MGRNQDNAAGNDRAYSLDYDVKEGCNIENKKSDRVLRMGQLCAV